MQRDSLEYSIAQNQHGPKINSGNINDERIMKYDCHYYKNQVMKNH